MSIKFKLTFPTLIVLLLIIVNIILFFIIDMSFALMQNMFNINIPYILSLLSYAFILALMSYIIITKLSNDNNLLNENLFYKNELHKALNEINQHNNDLQNEIANRKKLEDTIINSEYHIRDIINKAPTGVALLDQEGWILECNPALQNMLGYEEEELTGVLFVHTIHPHNIDEFKIIFERLIKGEIDVCKIDTRYIHREFQDVWGSFSASILRKEENQPKIIIAMVEDITIKQQAEEKIVSYQKQLQTLTSELSLIEERERRRIANNLHDHVGQVLTLVAMKIDNLQEKVASSNCDHLIQEIRKQIQQTIKSIRSLMFELSPPILYDLGLEEAIEWLAEHFSQEYKIIIKVNKDAQSKPLKNERNIILFQSVRELLSNIVKHSQANIVNISLQRACNYFRIVIEDNGIGFDNNLIDQENNKLKGFGLFNIYERLEYVGGSMTIESVISQGTKIILMMPMVFFDKKNYYKNLLEIKQNKYLAVCR